MADKKNSKRLSPDQIARMRSDLLVGYGNPPVETRFKPGQSGNPSGRPRNRLPFDLPLDKQPALKTISEVLNKAVRVRDGEHVMEVTRLEAITMKAIQGASDGNARYYAMLVDLERTAEHQRAADAAKRREAAIQYIELKRKEMKDAKDKGLPEPRILPHPDDVLLDDELGCRIVGPIDEDELAKVQETARLRDLLIMQYVLDERQASPGDPESGAQLVAMVLDRCLPKRMRLDDSAWLRQERKSELMTIRELLKAAYRGWRSLGKPRPRGFRFASKDASHRLLGFLADMNASWAAGRLDIEAAARGDFDLEMQRIMAAHGVSG